ncbi:MAG: rod shape-determining protein MreC [Candidatus Dactylopiibacterium carminicum]|uniref:Cell shape-determining protein MreC n=1 Tax=Candidatus Dactylopiibacterium carminicum TaxID=857335 RepID=A0A272EWR6_9RHOO|nr:rod shape-determining protein MreC [Candidatus Dactylopiibacterium carminicum]KAF7600061.1 rod shape-determining protein MreC [Candidatus Dactylopiibacterium carminicum]PAS94549.1 MAG: rod shape-determining protein MreC [Candidatus Dactylopiibacterium carminicum]PAS97588.1 MAG: rod shape-determining protein MreC [Candidatus Dactylopiibacterium carminicum]PAT00063.1 MAG: rod shape-determining protein MreC [Candidatus Dactylopiibacterium carminicum]
MAVRDPVPPIFRRGLPRSARLTIFLLLTLALMVSDLQLRYLDALRQTLTVISYPLQIAAASPAEFFRNARAYFTNLATLNQENARLRAQQLVTARQLMDVGQLREENANMRRLLELRGALRERVIPAEIIFPARDPFSRKVILDKGSLNDIEPGSPVVDGEGVIGQITRVFPLHAEVTLLSDKNQAIPVTVQPSGLRAVMFGAGNGLMELKFLAANAEVKPGDRILTSGLDGIFVPGLPVAEVINVTRDSAESFARILCRPLGKVERSGAVLVLMRTEPAQQRPADEQALDPRRSTAGRIRNKAAAEASEAAEEGTP